MKSVARAVMIGWAGRDVDCGMATNAYHFITHWRVPATIDEVSEILGDALDLPRWWPSVYLAIEEIEPGDDSGVGRVIDLYTKGWLPYTLRWQFRVTQSDPPRGFSIEAWGDFVGRGIWTFEQDGPEVVITYDWEIAAEKALLRRLSALDEARLRKESRMGDAEWASKPASRTRTAPCHKRSRTVRRPPPARPNEAAPPQNPRPRRGRWRSRRSHDGPPPPPRLTRHYASAPHPAGDPPAGRRLPVAAPLRQARRTATCTGTRGSCACGVLVRSAGRREATRLSIEEKKPWRGVAEGEAKRAFTSFAGPRQRDRLFTTKSSINRPSPR